MGNTNNRKKEIQNPRIVVTIETKKKLGALGGMGDTYDTIITKLIESYRKNNNAKKQTEQTQTGTDTEEQELNTA